MIRFEKIKEAPAEAPKKEENRFETVRNAASKTREKVEGETPRRRAKKVEEDDRLI